MEITTADFEQKVLKCEKPVLVDFYADWCGPCKMMAPIIAEFAQKYADKVDVYKLNIDKSFEIAAKYNVMSIPTLILFKNGEPAQKSVGLIGLDDVEKLVF